MAAAQTSRVTEITREGLTESECDIVQPDLIARVIKAHADLHVTAHGENETTTANKQPLIDPFHQQWQNREDQKLRQAHPDEHFTDLQRAVALNGTEIKGDQKNGAVKCQTESKSNDRRKGQIATDQ